MMIWEWIIWSIAVIISVSFVINLRAEAKNGRMVHIITIAQTIIQLVVCLLFLFLPWNKLHLLWVMPLTLILANLGFIIFRIPVIGLLLRIIVLRVANVLFLGVEAKIAGVPFGK